MDREILRLQMQLKRFELFREDIRDLVELTVGKMEMYHLVGALFLEFCVALYCEGRIHVVAPPFILALFYLAVASAFMYLVLAVWLSMHASICSHSFGVRLLTRFVRLPIPGQQQFQDLNAKLADFEKQGVGQIMRIPWAGRQKNWMGSPLAPVQEEGGPTSPTSPKSNVHRPGDPTSTQKDWLGTGQQAILKESELMKATSRLPGEHVALFRRLQAKWQCFDAYARVCMALGANQLILSLTYYLIITMLIQYRSPIGCLVLLITFQTGAFALTYLDIAKLGRFMMIVLQLTALAPVVIAAMSIAFAKQRGADEGFQLAPNQAYPASPACFFFMALWFEGLLRSAWPSKDEATLPRRFRAVLFLDVFDDAMLDPLEHEKAFGDTTGEEEPAANEEPEDSGSGSASRDEQGSALEQAAVADEAVYIAHAALRRWEAVPFHEGMTQELQKRIAKLRRQATVWRNALNTEAARRAAKLGMQEAEDLLQEDDRAWVELEESEQLDDPHAGAVLGPFRTPARAAAMDGAPDAQLPYYFDLEQNEFVWEVKDGQHILTIDDTTGFVEDAEVKVRTLLGLSMDEQFGSELDGDEPQAGPLDRSFIKKLRREVAGAPQRLPWRVLHGTTRWLQLAWCLVGIVMAVEEAKTLSGFDVQLPFAARVGRRLKGLRRSLEVVHTSWPTPDLFVPEGLQCLPGSAGELTLLVQTRSQTYRLLEGAEGRSWELSTEKLPASSALACLPGWSAAPSNSSCFTVSPQQDATLQLSLVAPSSWRETVTLPLLGRPWRFAAGAVVTCEGVSELLFPDPAQETAAEWCLLLAGWDGEHIPVAALRLPPGDSLQLPLAKALVRPAFDAPLALQPGLPGGPEVKIPVRKPPPRRQDRDWKPKKPPRSALVCGRPASVPSTTFGSATVVSLAIEPQEEESSMGLRLWALHEEGSVQVWSLQPAHSLGRWPLLDMEEANFTETSFAARDFCLSREDSQASVLHVVGRRGGARPELLRLRLPSSGDL